MADRGKKALGRQAEEFAAQWLRARGYRILERNYTRPWGEADIIARDRDGTTVIVEVRSRSDARRRLELLESVDWRKQRQLRRLAQGLLAQRNRHIDIRIDVIAVVADEHGALRVHSHIRNAVEDA